MPLAFHTTERDAYRSVVDKTQPDRAGGFADRLGWEVTAAVVPGNLISL